jgi:hypothetical protein
MTGGPQVVDPRIPDPDSEILCIVRDRTEGGALDSADLPLLDGMPNNLVPEFADGTPCGLGGAPQFETG